MKRGYVLLTGATGLLGQYLLRDLLRDGERIAVLIRGNRSQSAEERLEQILQFWEQELGQALPRPVCLAGDITQPNLALDRRAIDWSRQHVDRMFHCAASLTFQEQKGEPWRTNVDGTRHVVDFCNHAQIPDMHYVSTAYVCGRRQDVVYEDELDVGQQFRNDYEKSKFLAEKIVRESTQFRQRTIYRPVVITGDATTGYTSTYHGTYLYMKLAQVLSRNIDPDENGNHHIPIRWGARGTERRNITPVDWNSQVICRLLSDTDAHGRTFHLAPAEPLTMRDVIEYASRYFRLTGIEFHGYGDDPDFRLNEMERWIWSNVKIYGDYDFMDPQFDTTNLQPFISDLPCPRIDYAIAERLMEYAELDRWGKRKRPLAEPGPIDVAATLQQLCSDAPVDDLSATTVVGLDVVGPGGGPFRLVVLDDAIVAFDSGLPLADEAESTISISSAQFAEYAQNGALAASLLGTFKQPAKEVVSS